MTPAAQSVDTQGEEQTRQFGRLVGQALQGGEVVALIGPLGAGKTQLVKGVAWGNGHDDASLVTSPTFTLVNEYPGQLHLYHLDAYRLGGGEELLDLGFAEMVTPESAVLIEWADRATAVLPADRLTIGLQVTSDTARRLSLTAGGPSSQRLLDELTTGDPPLARQ